MPRLVLFLLVFLGVMIAMRQCAQPPPLPPAVPVEPVAIPEEPHPSLEAGDLRARFAPDGTLLSLTDGEATIVRPAPAARRPLTLLFRHEDGRTVALDPARWESMGENGVLSFHWDSGDGLLVRKTVTLSEDGLRVELSVAGGGERLAGMEMTAASGVPLEGEAPSGAFWEFAGSKPQFESYETLARRQDQRRTALEGRRRRGEEVSPDYAHHVSAGARELRRFGVLGADRFFGVVGPLAVHELHVQALRVEHEGPALEAWMSLQAEDGGLETSISFGWKSRAAIAQAEPDLFSGAQFRDEREFVLENDTLRYVFTDRGGAVVEGWLKTFHVDPEGPEAPENWVPILRPGVRPGQRALTLSATGERYGVDPGEAFWDVARDGADGLRFTLETPTGWSFEKLVRLPEEGRFDLAVTVTVRRPEQAPEKTAIYTLTGPAGAYIADSYREITAGDPAAGLVLERDGDEISRSIDDLREDPIAVEYQEEHARGQLRAVAVRGAFFVCALRTAERTDAEGRPAGNVTQATVAPLELSRDVTRPDGSTSRENLYGAVTVLADLAQGAQTDEYVLYGGPNERGRLRPLELADTVDYGTFGFIGRALMGLMELFAGLIGSYGVAIMLMTLVVRALLFPVSYKTQLGMQRYSKRMQKLKPMLDELEKKYGKNRQKLNQERMRLMREHGLGLPLGCLTIFLQIPIWIALFQALRVEFALRHEPFLWAADLTMPDRLFALPFWPHWFNLLPILMLGLWIWQQKTAPTPASDDPQVQMQMKMVRFMPYVFFLFLYKYAAALSVYMCVSSIWGIVEGKMVRRAIARMP